MTIYGNGPITIRHEPDMTVVNYGGCDYGIIPATYLMGWDKPNYPVPAIPLNTVLYSDVYIGCMYIERLNYGEDDPVIVYLYDSWEDVSEYE